MRETLEHELPAATLPEGVDVLVVGGGVSGLVTARELRRLRPEWSVLVVESETTPGGTMRTERAAGCLCEWGPAGFLTHVPFTRDLALELGLAGNLLPALRTAEKRYLWVRNALRPLPLKPPAFLRSDLLSVSGRMRVLAEPFMGRPAPESEESILSFASRRIGREAAAVLVDAMVSGIYAGDPARLSLRATFPKMADMEAQHGSLTKAMIALRRARRKVPDAKRSGSQAGGPAGPGGVLTTFDEGMEVLIQALAGSLGPRLVTAAKVTGLGRSERGYRIQVCRGERVASIEARRVVLAVPSFVSADLLRELSPLLSAELAQIPYAGLTVACLVYRRPQISHPLDGFGFLVPRGQGLRMLGAIWVGSIFPPHVPEDRVLMRVMVGGARDPEGPLLSEARTVDFVHNELSQVLGGIQGSPLEVVLFRHPKGIPQYVLGHPKRLLTLERELAKLPGLRLAGNAYRGIGVNDCVREARELALRMAESGASVSPLPVGGRA